MNGKKNVITAIDVNYREEGALAAGVVFRRWSDNTPEYEICVYLPEVTEYIPGSFYLRELPCILSLLKELPEKPDIIIIDGYVRLGESGSDGLGMKLFNALKGKSKVIGVAKTEFAGTPEDTRVFRGNSSRPLYVTSVGIDHEKAKQYIGEMSGQFRIPELIKRADKLSRLTEIQSTVRNRKLL